MQLSAMDAERFAQIQHIFSTALELPESERATYIHTACGSDTELRNAVKRYVSADAEGFLLIDQPLLKVKDLNGVAGAFSFGVGQKIGKYEVKYLLGEGGMGMVYLARDPELERDVAVKILSNHLIFDDNAKARLISEAKAAAALDHPHVATIYEVGQTANERLFIAMGYYEGETLEKKIERSPLSVEEAINIAKQVLLGLQAAHKKNVIHRDIKPANLIITHGGKVKIVDFGIAKIAGHDQEGQGQIIGTVAYMSPEQAQGLKIDQRTDLWSLGVVLYEMLTGERPFRGGNMQEKIDAILNDPPEPMGHHLDEVEYAMQQIIDRLLVKSANVRYQEAAEVILDLERIGKQARIGARDHLSAKDDEMLLNNLPSYLSSFVGRESEFNQVVDILANQRLLTITGAGGAGKTRFSVFVASAIRSRFKHGICFVSLASVVNPGLVASSIAKSLGVREMKGELITKRLIDFLREKNGLLLIDNFEQVVDAGKIIPEILSKCPELTILITSRISLHIRGEYEFPLPALSLVANDSSFSVEQIKQCESVALFDQRAHAIKPSFCLEESNVREVVEICARLDGLPLAIELAAARIKVLPPKAILERLNQRLSLLTGGARDLPTRHRTLREAIAWSYDLLSKDEKKQFRWFSVFLGEFTFEAAEYLSQATAEFSFDVLDSLESLVNKNLLRQETGPEGDAFFLTLETIREFGLECLKASGEELIVRQFHCNYYLEYVEKTARLLTGPDQRYWLDRLENEHSNILSAIKFSLHQDRDVVTAARLCTGLWQFWLVRGYLSEGVEYLEEVLHHLTPDTDAVLRANVLMAAGTLAHNCGQYRQALSWYEENLALCTMLDDVPGIAHAQINLGWIKWRLSDYASAKSFSEEGLKLHTALKDLRGIALSHSNLGWVAHYASNFESARGHFEKAVNIHKRLGNKRNIGFVQNCMGWAWISQGNIDRGIQLLKSALLVARELEEKQLMAFTQGRLGIVQHVNGEIEEARELLERESLPLFRKIGDAWGVASAAAGLGHVLQDCGDYSEAAELYEHSLSIREELEDAFAVAESLCRIAELNRHTNAAELAVELYQKSLRKRLQIGDKLGQIECLEGIAFVYRDLSKITQSICLLSAAEVGRGEHEITRNPREQIMYDNAVRILRTEASKQHFNNCWERGQKFTSEERIEVAFSGDVAI